MSQSITPQGVAPPSTIPPASPAQEPLERWKAMRHLTNPLKAFWGLWLKTAAFAWWWQKACGVLGRKHVASLAYWKAKDGIREGGGAEAVVLAMGSTGQDCQSLNGPWVFCIHVKLYCMPHFILCSVRFMLMVSTNIGLPFSIVCPMDVWLPEV